jgi:hypothetical protein
MAAKETESQIKVPVGNSVQIQFLAVRLDVIFFGGNTSRRSIDISKPGH